jgi:hypothetical protein
LALLQQNLIRNTKLNIMTKVSNEEQSNNANVLLAGSKNGLAPKLFELGWGWYEDWSYHLFIHFGKTQDDFKQDVKSLLVKYGKDYLASEQSWAGANGWVDFIAEKMPELGYQPIKPIRESFFGAYIIEGNEDDAKAWGEVVGEELLQEAITHNNKIREEMDKKHDAD